MNNKILALDIETTGLDPWRDEITMVGLWDGETYTCCRNAQALQDVLNEKYPRHEIVGHNVTFDLKFLQVQNWFCPQPPYKVHDTKILAHLVRHKVPQEFLEQYEIMRREKNKELPKGQGHRDTSALSLKVLAPWYLKVPPFWETPGNHDNEEYNQKDCMYTYRLFHVLSERVKAEGGWDFYINRMLPWAGMLREMEIKGISISLEELDKVEQEYLAKREQLKSRLDEMWWNHHEAYRQTQIMELSTKYGEMCNVQTAKGRDRAKTEKKYADLFMKAAAKVEKKINFSSPAQMAWLLKERLHLDITNLEGDESTNKSVLNKLASEGREDIQTFLDWREADKVLTMYLPTYQELQIDGVIHPSFNLTGTRTGRTSSSSPNLQQVPSKLYRLFKPRPGHKFVQYDLSGIEAALIALYSGDKKLYEILEKGESIHDHNAKALFGLECTIEEVASRFPRERKTAKNIGFACFYGAGWKRISAVFSTAGFVITDQDAKEKLARLKAYYPQVFEFHKEITEVFDRGETVFNLLGRPLTLQPHENPYMQGFNTLIQSSASDLNLEACHRFSKNGATPLLVIHDCIMAEAEIGESQAAARHLKRCMTDFKLESINGPIKLKVEGGVSDEWEK